MRLHRIHKCLKETYCNFLAGFALSAVNFYTVSMNVCSTRLKMMLPRITTASIKPKLYSRELIFTFFSLDQHQSAFICVPILFPIESTDYSRHFLPRIRRILRNPSATNGSNYFFNSRVFRDRRLTLCAIRDNMNVEESGRVVTAYEYEFSDLMR